MNKVSITLSQMGESHAKSITALLAEVEPNTHIVFEKGEYYIFEPIEIKGLKNVVFDGGGATFVAHFDRKKYYQDNTDLFHISECSDFKFCNFTIDSDVPVNVAGEIVAHTENYIDVQLNSSVNLEGDELFISSMTFKEDMTPVCDSFVSAEPDESRYTVIANEIVCTNPEKLDTPHEMIGDQLFRIYPYCVEGTMREKKCNISHSYYGLVAVSFRNCHRVEVEDISIVNYGGFGFAILPRCSDFTFRRLRIEPKDIEHQPFSINSDGIHVTGLTGKLIVEDCYFEQLGDDCINLHTNVMNVTEVFDDGVKINYDKKVPIVPPIWAQKGDKLRVYNPHTLEFKGYATVADFKDKRVWIDEGSIKMQVGDLITNEYYFPTVEISRVTCKNCRSRPFVLQSTDSAKITDCDIFGCGPAIYISAAFYKWLEAGPAKNIEIVGNRFHPTATRNNSNMGCVFIRLSEDPQMKFHHIHKNMVIKNNSFEGIPYYPIWVYATDGVKIEGNTFTDCNGNGDIFVKNCTDVNIKGNRSFENKSERDVKIIG